MPCSYAGRKEADGFSGPRLCRRISRSGLRTSYARQVPWRERPRAFAFTLQAAKYVAVAMAYDDVIRVADLKVRESRFERVRKEVGAKDDQVVYMTEYMHPRMEEVRGTLPKAARSLDRETVRSSLASSTGGSTRAGGSGRQRSSGFMGLYMSSPPCAAAGAARSGIRPRDGAHGRLAQHSHRNCCRTNYDLATEVLATRRLGQRLFRHPCARPCRSSTGYCQPCRCCATARMAPTGCGG